MDPGRIILGLVSMLTIRERLALLVPETSLELERALRAFLLPWNVAV